MLLTRSLRAIATFGCVILLAAGNAKAKNYAYFVEQLIDLDRLTILDKGIQCKQFSSFDRASRYDEITGKYVQWEANGDAGKYIRTDPQTGEGVMAEIDGPGCIWRIWSANPQGKIRFYFDGSRTPGYEFDFAELFTGKVPGFPRPLVWQRKVVLGGDNPASNSYVPITFNKSCKVTADKPYNQYYHIGYTTYPSGWRVPTFSIERTDADHSAVQRVCNLLNHCGQDPQPADNMSLIDHSVPLPAGDRIVKEIDGPATIRQFFAKLDSQERWARRKVVLQIHFDGEPIPAVDAPIGDFFGDAWNESPYSSLPMGITEDLNYCYWRMPFAKSAKIVFINEGRQSAKLHYKVTYLPGKLPDHSGMFHAKWRRDRNSKEFDYPLLAAQGHGRFIGAVLFPDNILGGWWGEGDEKVWVDDEKFPSTFGTGSEDYFGDAWGIRYFVNPFHGCPTAAGLDETRRQSCYRWHIADSIPFQKSFKMTIENYAALTGEPIRNDYSSMAYWYQEPATVDFFRTTPVTQRIPQGPIRPGAIDAEGLTATLTTPGKIETLTDDDLPEQLCNGAGLKITGPAGTTAILEIPAPDDGPYGIEIIPAKGIKASEYELLKDDRTIGERVRLSKGINKIAVRLTGQPVNNDECAIIVDFLLLHPWRNFIREWLVCGPFDNTNWSGLERPYGPETSGFDPHRKYAGKDGEVGWQKAGGPDGRIDFLKYFKDNRNSVAYAYCEVIAPDDFKTTAYLGSDDGVKVWLNGQLVHSKREQRALRLDQDQFEVNLKKGSNTLLLKVDQGEGDWCFAFRLIDLDDRLQYSIPK